MLLVRSLDTGVRSIRLDSGLTVLHQYAPATPVMVADVWVGAGAIEEPDDWLGTAHFLEHMVFKGTETIAPGEFDRAIEQYGGTANAATSHDYAHFFITAAADRFEDMLPFLAEILLRPGLDEEEFYLERDVVIEEMHQCQDDPEWVTFQALMRTLYCQHPYGRAVIGTQDKLMRCSPERMHRFHRRHYQPQNMVVALAGSLEPERAIACIERAFDCFRAPVEDYPPIEVRAEPPFETIRRTEFYLPRIEQARLVVAWPGPPIAKLREGVGLDLLSAILGEGRSSRLVRELREEKRLVQGIYSGFSLQRDSSFLTVNAWLEPQRANLVENLIRDRVAELQKEPISPEELDRAKRLLCNDFAFSTETPIQLAGLYGYYQTLADVSLATTYPHEIRSFTAEELHELAQRYLSPDRYAVTVALPETS